MTSPDNSVIQIGAWRVDPALDEISRDGKTTKLEPKMMRLLLCLAAHAGQVVSVEQLLDEVWEGVVVTPDSVYHAVAALRRVLGDDSKDPTYISNVMRRGYRLISPVVPLGMAVAPAPSLQPQHSAAGAQATKPTVELPQSHSIRVLIGYRLEIAIVTVLAAALAYFVIDKVWISKHSSATELAAPLAQTTPRASAPPTTAAVFTPPPHSIAVLPFVNMSGDKEQDYFSDGLSEELTNSLSRISELQVAARTSSFYFKGEHADLPTIAHKLNVGAVLEGSVRRSANTVRITVQLVNGISGFHLWSQTYDRNLGDVLKLQTEIATAVATALKVSLVGDEAAKIEVGGTHNPAAFDAYLHGSKAYITRHEEKDLNNAIAAYTDAIQLDPNYARAFVGRSFAIGEFAAWWTETEAAAQRLWVKAGADARKAIELAPELGEAHLALADTFFAMLDFARARDEYERALALAPGNVQVVLDYSLFAVLIGRSEAGIAAARRAVMLDPLNRDSHGMLGQVLLAARQYEQSIAAFRDALALDPQYPWPFMWAPDYLLGDFEAARAACEGRSDDVFKHECLALVYNKLGRHAEAEVELAKAKALADDDWYHFAEIYAQWGDTARALDSLGAALRTRHEGLEYLKIDPLVDSLRKEPRFQEIERELKFPN